MRTLESAPPGVYLVRLCKPGELAVSCAVVEQNISGHWLRVRFAGEAADEWVKGDEWEIVEET